MCRCTETSTYALGLLSGAALLTHSGNMIIDQCLDQISSNVSISGIGDGSDNQHQCWVLSSMYFVVGATIIITDVFKCKPIAKKLAVYQSFKGRSFIYLFIALPLLSTYDGDFNKTASDPLDSVQNIPLVVGLILLINSIIFLLFSLCHNGPFPKRGVIAALRGDRDDDFPTGFEEDKSTMFDDAVELHQLENQSPQNQFRS